MLYQGQTLSKTYHLHVSVIPLLKLTEMFEDNKHAIRCRNLKNSNVSNNRIKTKIPTMAIYRKLKIAEHEYFLLHEWHPSCYSIYKSGDKSWMRKVPGSACKRQVEEVFLQCTTCLFHRVLYTKILFITKWTVWWFTCPILNIYLKNILLKISYCNSQRTI